jgi:hypothetical protein
MHREEVVQEGQLWIEVNKNTRFVVSGIRRDLVRGKLSGGGSGIECEMSVETLRMCFMRAPN